MAESTEATSTPQTELLLLEARLEGWCEQFEEARASMNPKDAKKTELRLQAMRQRLNVLLLEKGLFAEPQDKIPPMDQLDEQELAQVAESLQQSVEQFEKLKGELQVYQAIVKKELLAGRPVSLKKANDELRAKLDGYMKHEAQFRPIEELVGNAGRQMAGRRDPLQAFLRISMRLQDMSQLNQSIQSQHSMKESMSQWLRAQRQRFGAMAFQAPPSEQSLDQSTELLSKVATINQSLSRLGRARRYLEGFLSKNGVDVDA